MSSSEGSAICGAVGAFPESVDVARGADFFLGAARLFFGLDEAVFAFGWGAEAVSGAGAVASTLAGSAAFSASIFGFLATSLRIAREADVASEFCVLVSL
jgi:hypothetical protein